MRVELDDLFIETPKRGLAEPTKGDFPVRYGWRSEITTPRLTLELDLSGRIKYVTGRSSSWPNPSEYLKRTDGNDWVFYSLGEYADYLGVYGEHYLPCPQYLTNRPLGGEPFPRAHVAEAMSRWSETIAALRARARRLPEELAPFVASLARSDPRALEADAEELHRIIGAPIPVLPPDARHVDYDVIPLLVADGCRYHCRFCRVKHARAFAPRSRAQVAEQLLHLKRWLGAGRGERFGLFLGLQDALAIDDELLRWALEAAYRDLGFAELQSTRPQLFLFGSVGALLAKPAAFFDWLDASPWSSFINVGFEAADDATLKMLGKPLTASEVEAGFQRMIDLNAHHPNLEVTGNFVLLPEPGAADEAMVELMQRSLPRRSSRCCCYLSPLLSGQERPRASRRALLRRIHRLQRAAPLPLYLYLIQRL